MSRYDDQWLYCDTCGLRKEDVTQESGKAAICKQCKRKAKVALYTCPYCQDVYVGYNDHGCSVCLNYC